MKISLSTIILLIAAGLFLIYKFGQTDSALEIADYSIALKKSHQSIPINIERNAYYGDLHVHTRYSFDAYVFGVTATPDDAYRYAKGEAIKHPLGFDMQLREPLDFYGVTDHGFFMGMIEAYADTSSPASRYPWAKPYHNLNREENLTIDSSNERINIFSASLGKTINNPYPLWHPKVIKAWFTRNTQLALKSFDYNIHKSAWEDIATTAEKHNDPGNFTTFIGYEFTSSTPIEGGNLHRNVIFNSNKIPIRPWTRIDSINPEDLWDWMDNLREKGVDSIAIPHNSNGSNGQMFEVETFRGDAIDSAFSDKRMRNEPIVELTQVKGTSETHPLLSPDDEWANFEIMDRRVGSVPPTYSLPAGSYSRDAYLRGLTLEWKGQGNPYKFGVIGSSDTHTGGGAMDEFNYWSKTGILDGTPQGRGSVPLSNDQIQRLKDYSEQYQQPTSTFTTEQGTYSQTGFDQWGASGLAVAWAENNTREAIFNAFKRKETFATSGSRIAVRFFAGYDMNAINLDSPTLVKSAYARGVTMGADLPAQGSQVPEFIIWAQQDKNAAPLQRVQIIKGWVESGSGTPHEKVYDVACSDNLKVDLKTHRCPDNGARVNIKDCSISNDKGATELKTHWRDPDFDPEIKAFYYVRVLENPTCRWSTWDAIKVGVKPREDLHKTIQERAWTSPIWYIPNTKKIGITPL